MLKLSQLQALFPTEESCKAFLTKHRWPDAVRCPRCGHEKVYELKKRPFHWQCHRCHKKGYRFSVITGTVFENTKYPLRTWFTVAFMMLHSKKGMSALQIKRMVFHDKASYETVWYMCQRIRAAMDNDEFRELMGEVEIDETYVGGKVGRHRHRPSGGGDRRRTAKDNKTPVIGAIARKGSVVAQVIENADAPTVKRFVRETVSDRVSLIATDEAPRYRGRALAGYTHEAVDHSKGEYVRSAVHTQNLDSFWSLLKRGIMGSLPSGLEEVSALVRGRVHVPAQPSRGCRYVRGLDRRMLRPSRWRRSQRETTSGGAVRRAHGG